MNVPLFLVILGIASGLYILALIISSIRNTPIESTIGLSEVQSRLRKANPALEWLVPIGLTIAFIYNVFASSIWLIGLAVKGISWLISLVITQFLIPGPWLVLKILFHYFIFRPWQLIRESFRNLPANWNWSHLKIAISTLTIVFFLSFLGRTISALNNGLSWIQIPLNIFSLIALALGLVQLVSSFQSAKVSFLSRRSLTYLFGLLGIWAMLGLIQLAFVKLATFSSWSETLVSLLHGGGLALSFLIMINAIYLLFTLLALPAFLAEFQGGIKDFLPEFGKYIWRKGWDLALIIPSGFLAALLLTAIPYTFLSGVNHLTKFQQNDALVSRIENLQVHFNELSNQINRDSWMTLTEEDLENQFANDLQVTDVSIQLAVLNSSTELNASLTSNLDNDFGLLPIRTVALFYGSLQENISKLIPGYSTDESAYTMYRQHRVSNLSKAQSSVEQMDALRARAKAIKQQICYPNASKKKSSQPDTTTTINYPKEDLSVDDCQLAELRLNELNKKVARAQKIEDHEAMVLDKVSGKIAARGVSSFISTLLVGIWGSLLWASVLSLALILYARLVNFIGTTNSEPYLVNSLRAEDNPNQPTLALLILSALCAFFISTFGSYTLNLSSVQTGSFNLPKITPSQYDNLEGSSLERSSLDDQLEREISESQLTALLNDNSDIDDSDLEAEIEAPSQGLNNQTESVPTTSTKKSKFTCKDGNAIDPSWINDGECDCPDCEDED
jgi:hypothetical protein